MYVSSLLKILIIPFVWISLISCTESGSGESSGGSQTGRGGSTARMTIQGDYLYAIAGTNVQLLDITSPSAPSPWVTVPVAWDIETLFPYGDYLLIGAESGMHIMDNTNPAEPFYLAEFTHARARDPVVANNGYAYVTLKSDADGFSGVNQMDVINLANISNPTLVKTLPMQSPSGLAVAQNNLYVCDGIAGLKIFDVTDPASPTFSESIRDLDCNDVIVQDGLMYVITDGALLQYDSTVSPPVLLSQVTAQAE